MKIIEFMTGMSPDTPLIGELRSWTSFEGLMVQKNAAHGRRAREMKLPLDWKVDGVFRLEVVDSGLTIHHNFTKEQIHLKAESL
eukprot:515373-Prorocentrum_lima.AAC.1